MRLTGAPDPLCAELQSERDAIARMKHALDGVSLSLKLLAEVREAFLAADRNRDDQAVQEQARVGLQQLPLAHEALRSSAAVLHGACSDYERRWPRLTSLLRTFERDALRSGN